jgi:hypothetical protein
MFNIAVLNTEKDHCTSVKQVGTGYVQTEFDVVVSEFDFNYVGKNYHPVTEFTVPDVVEPATVPLFPIADLVITDALDAPILFANGAYQPDKNQPFAITANVVNGEGAVQTAFNATGLKVVFIRTVANQLTQDQHLLKCSIIDGVLTINGAFDVSGVWRLDVAYNNRVLQSLGFGFGIDHADIEFWV